MAKEVSCPECDSVVEIESSKAELGDIVYCEDCNAMLTITGLDTLEVDLFEVEDEDDELDDYY